MIISEINISLKFLLACLLIIVISLVIGFRGDVLLFSMVLSMFGIMVFIILELIGIKLKEIYSF